MNFSQAPLAKDNEVLRTNTGPLKLMELGNSTVTVGSLKSRDLKSIGVFMARKLFHEVLNKSCSRGKYKVSRKRELGYGKLDLRKLFLFIIS